MKPITTVWLGILAVVLLAGCQLTRSINWDSRVGGYTFDQAVIEMGPPDSQAKLSDGRLVAQWITRHSAGGAVLVGGGFNGYPAGVGVVQTAPSYYENKLVLTFGTNNVLAAWAKK